jgi:hypothetical protein
MEERAWAMFIFNLINPLMSMNVCFMCRWKMGQIGDAYTWTLPNPLHWTCFTCKFLTVYTFNLHKKLLAHSQIVSIQSIHFEVIYRIDMDDAYLYDMLTILLRSPLRDSDTAPRTEFFYPVLTSQCRVLSINISLLFPHHHNARFRVFMMVKSQVDVSWVVTPCSVGVGH